MATATELGLIAAGISVAIIGSIQVGAYVLKPYDPVKARYELIDTECAKRRPDGGRREVVWMSGFSKLGKEGSKDGYVPCPEQR